jgi:hypothetical protein
MLWPKGEKRTAAWSIFYLDRLPCRPGPETIQQQGSAARDSWVMRMQQGELFTNGPETTPPTILPTSVVFWLGVSLVGAFVGGMRMGVHVVRLYHERAYSLNLGGRSWMTRNYRGGRGC